MQQNYKNVFDYLNGLLIDPESQLGAAIIAAWTEAVRSQEVEAAFDLRCGRCAHLEHLKNCYNCFYLQNRPGAPFSCHATKQCSWRMAQSPINQY
jgi:hypothetical protein